jgi:hypothetical protein
MTSLEAYKRFQLKLNKLDSSDNIDIVTGEFVMIFNEQQIKWYSSRYTSSSEVTLGDVEAFVEPDFKLTKSSTKSSNCVEYTLPSNWFDYISSYSTATKDACKNKRLKNFRVKIADAEIYYSDENNSPSFEFGETFVAIAKNRLRVYKTDFTLGDTYLTYYRYPVSIDIAGYKKVDGTSSSTINPELADEFVSEIIDLCVLEVQRSSENRDGFQLSNDRLQQDI